MKGEKLIANDGWYYYRKNGMLIKKTIRWCFNVTLRSNHGFNSKSERSVYALVPFVHDNFHAHLLHQCLNKVLFVFDWKTTIGFLFYFRQTQPVCQA